MSALTAGEVAAACGDLASMLPDTCTVQRGAKAPDGGGGYTETWPPVATGVPCRLSAKTSAKGSDVGEHGDRTADDTIHQITLPAGQDVQLGDRAVIGATTYEVVQVRVAGAWELARHVLVREAPL